MAIKTEERTFKQLSAQRPIDLFLSRLQKVKAIGKNKWIALCPSHPDKHPSLNVALGSNGNPIFICRAGCSSHDVISAAGLNFSDLFETKTSQRAAKLSMLV